MGLRLTLELGLLVVSNCGSTLPVWVLICLHWRCFLSLCFLLFIARIHSFPRYALLLFVLIPFHMFTERTFAVKKPKPNFTGLWICAVLWLGAAAEESPELGYWEQWDGRYTKGSLNNSAISLSCWCLSFVLQMTKATYSRSAHFAFPCLPGSRWPSPDKCCSLEWPSFGGLFALLPIRYTASLLCVFLALLGARLVKETNDVLTTRC